MTKEQSQNNTIQLLDQLIATLQEFERIYMDGIAKLEAKGIQKKEGPNKYAKAIAALNTKKNGHDSNIFAR